MCHRRYWRTADRSLPSLTRYSPSASPSDPKTDSSVALTFGGLLVEPPHDNRIGRVLHQRVSARRDQPDGHEALRQLLFARFSAPLLQGGVFAATYSPSTSSA